MPPKVPKGTRKIQRAVSFSDNEWERLRAESMRTGKSMSLILREALNEYLELRAA